MRNEELSALQSVYLRSYNRQLPSGSKTPWPIRAISQWTSLVLCAAAIGGYISGCSSMGSMQVPITPPGPTSVTMAISSTGNDQLTEFGLTIASINLISKSGTSVNIYNNPNINTPPQGTEFMHENGNSEPLVSASVPQDLYTSASVAFIDPNFTYLTVDSTRALSIHTDVDQFGTQLATVNLPSPIAISGPAMILRLDLVVPQSETFTTGVTPNPDKYTITPTFTLTAVVPASAPTNDKNGKQSGIQGRVATVDTTMNTFTIGTPNHVMLSGQIDANTVFQGIGSLSELTTGMFVNMDTAVQVNGSLLAKRVEVKDTTARNVLMGQLLDQGPSPAALDVTIIDVMGVQQQGDDLTTLPINVERYQLASDTSFVTSGQFTNIASLPFLASFSAANLVTSQQISVTSPLVSFVANPSTMATTITLMPQTVNGTVTATSSSGNFQIYTVSLAANDPIVSLNGATSVVVYTDASTQMLNSTTLGNGSLMRFRGLVFNDNGTLRMDCNQVNDGVAE